VALYVSSSETPESFLTKLQALERQFGRKPKKILNEPRVLDLDLLTFGNELRSGPLLTLPHPRAHVRRFVLAPWAELAPDWVPPGQTRMIRELLAELDDATSVHRLA
jgi:2-amino-4-hydroxy-6-hydroxymethyldihydropteridine diphosphokinase